MMKPILLIVNILLTIIAVFLTLSLLNSVSKDRPPPRLKNIYKPNSNAPKKRHKEKNDKESKTRPLSTKESNILWEDNLFHPDRMWMDQVQEIKINDEEEAKDHFELVSIAQIGDTSCASIRVITDQNRSRRRLNSRNRRQRTRNPRRSNRTNRSRRTRRAVDNQKIYRLHASVGETGFKLEQIGIDFVKLKKGEQEIRLTLDKGDEASSNRRENAIKEQKKKASNQVERVVRDKEENKQKDKKERNEGRTNPPRRLPPPPNLGNSSLPTSNSQEREGSPSR